MNINAIPATLADILPLRGQYLRQMNAQIRYHACHERGWSDTYLLKAGGEVVGYGSVKGKEEIVDRDAVFECYVLPPFRRWADSLFAGLLAVSGARYIECQSNDSFLSSLLYLFAADIYSDVILFEDHATTDFRIPGIVFRPRREGDALPGPDGKGGAYVLEKKGEVVAAGGFLLHYNMPFADLYMEVKEEYRQQGLGCFILQELKQACYLSGRVPAARCNIRNTASRATLLKAGLRICGFMLAGEVIR